MNCFTFEKLLCHVWQNNSSESIVYNIFIRVSINFSTFIIANLIITIKDKNTSSFNRKIINDFIGLHFHKSHLIP